MIFVSGICFSGKNIKNYRTFIFHRTPRLVVPVWLFLTFYFALIGALELSGKDTGLTVRHVVRSYLLLDGIGYVWVIRVFLLIMLLTPALLRLYHKVRYIIVFCVLAIVLQTVIVRIVIGWGENVFVFFVREFVLFASGYGVMFLCGLRAGSQSKHWRSALFWVVALIAYTVCIYICQPPETILPINANKYPPAGIYIVYGIAASLLLNLARPLLKRMACQFTDFVGSNTMWIYLYHIPFVGLFAKVGAVSALHWSVRYAIMLSLAVSITYVQVRFSRFAVAKWPWNGWKYLRG